MNAGAQKASGEILLFLHADTRLPERFDEQVRERLARPVVVADAFRLRIDGRRPVFRFIEWTVNLRSRWLQMPYGDQAIFLRSDIFHRLGGFPKLPIMEDFEFIRRLRRHGKIAITLISPGQAWASPQICMKVVLRHAFSNPRFTMSGGGNPR